MRTLRTACRALLTAVVVLCAANSAAIAQTLPSPWSASDIGSPQLAGSATLSGQTYTVKGSGADIYGTSDQFHFVYQPISGEADVILRIATLTNTHPYTKAGVMIRESLSPQSRNAMLLLASGAGYVFQRRQETAASTVERGVGYDTARGGWLRLVRVGDRFDAYRSTNGVSWTLVGSDTITMGATVYVGMALTSHQPAALATATFDGVQVTSSGSGNQSPAVSILQPATGSQYTAPASLTINASATDPENRMASVGFYVNSTLIATDTTSPYSTPWNTATPGTYTLTAMAHDADGGSSWSNTVTVTVQAAANGAPTVNLTSPTTGATFTAPATVNLTANATDPENQLARVEFFSGTTRLSTDTAAPYSFSWTGVAAGTYSLTAIAYDSAGASATSAAVSVTVQSGAAGLPDGQISRDIGSPAVAGQASYSGVRYTVRAAGSDIFYTNDQFHFVYRPVTGDVEIVARVVSQVNVNQWGKSGVMIRETLTGNSRHAMMATMPGNQAWFGRRLQPGGQTTEASIPIGTSSGWVRLVRTGSLFEAYWSANGASWTRVGSQTIAMAATVYVGMAATSHNTSTATTVVYENLAVTVPNGNQVPIVSLTAPANGTQFTAPATINLAASASDPEGQLARVEFFSGTTLLGTDTSAPYSYTWSSVAAGAYSLRAVAYDTTGASASSATVSVTVQGANQPPAVTLTSPTSGATFTAPASINLAANASDPEGQIARVEFFSGATQLNVDTTAPYAFTWSNVAAGSYSVRAVVYDNAGASASSATATITVSSGPLSPPTGVMFAASSDHATNVTSYLLSIYPQGADPATATPVGTSDLAKPTPAANNDITVYRASFFAGLPAADYIATVTAIGPGGQTRSAAVSFVR